MNIRKNKQKGFTLVELITVIAVVSLLAIYLSVEMGDAGEDAKVSMASAFLLSNVPHALNSYRARHAGKCEFADTENGATQVLKDRGLFKETPWGDIWEANFNKEARILTIAFPTVHADVPNIAAADIGKSVINKPQITAAHGGSDEPDIVDGVVDDEATAAAQEAQDLVDASIIVPDIYSTDPVDVVDSIDWDEAADFGTAYFIGCTPSEDMACISYKCN